MTYYNGVFYFSHTFLCVPAREVLNDIKKYVQANELSFVMLLFKPDWEYRSTFDTNAFKKLLFEIIGEDYYVKKSNANVGSGGHNFPTLSECIFKNQHIFCGFTEEYGAPEDCIWGSEYFNGIWIQSLDDNQFYESAKNFILNTQIERINHIPLVKTPTVDVVKTDVGNRFKLCFYDSQNLKVWSHFSRTILDRLKQEQINTTTLSIYWLDYV